jgi:hypothetical protein
MLVMVDAHSACLSMLNAVELLLSEPRAWFWRMSELCVPRATRMNL